MFFSILCLAFSAHLIQGASQCVRTNTDPSQACVDECTVQTGCRNSRKRCLCDGDCGYSCIYPRIRCSKPKKIRNGVITFKSFRFNDTQSVRCNSGFKLAGSAVRRCRGNGFWDGKQARCKRPQKSCPDPGKAGLLLRNIGTKKSFKPGTKLRYYCPDKFSLKGSRDLVCKKDGTWSAPLPQCIAPKCSAAVLPPHAKVFSPKNWKKRRDFGTRLSLSCDYGYTTTQRGTLICNVPDWRLEPSSFRCIPKSCPHPGRPRNGNVKGLFRFGERVDYTCDECYKLKGPSYRQCQADQQWTDTQPTCEPVRCSSLQAPANGYVTSNSQECGHVVLYHCNDNHKIIGPYSRRCQSDGTWSGREPVCQAKSCQDPGTPRGGNKRGNLQVGQTLHFSCNQCYQLRGNPTRICLPNQTWSGSQPRCSRVTCSKLQHPKNGEITSRSTQCRDRTVFKCIIGYQLRGSEVLTCQADGQWSAASPTCNPVKSTSALTVLVKVPLATKIVLKTSKTSTTKPKIQTTTVSPTAIRTTIAVNSSCGQPDLPTEATVRLNRGDRLFLVCKENYSTLNLGLMRCVKNRWTVLKNISCSAKACPDPGVPKNGYKHGVSYFIGDVVRFTCDDCHRLNGNSQRTCLKNKAWTGSQPNCVLKTCPLLKDTKQATVSQISQECKAVATYTCKDKTLTMLGSGEKICNTSGLWEGAEPKCINPNLNIAIGKPVSMSSYSPRWSQGPANIVVDGKRIGKAQLLHTKNENRPFIMINLQREEPVSTVIVVNRVHCCVNRINGFKVSVGNDDKKPTKNAECGGRSKALGGPNIIQCPRTLRGRYVFVYLPWVLFYGDHHIGLHEIEVYRLKMTE